MKLFLFDLDGTLTDPKIGITKSFQYALHYFGIEEENLDNLEKIIGPPLYNSFIEFYDFPKEKAWKGVDKYRERFETIGWKENKLYDGIPELLDGIKEAGNKLGIASSKPTVFVEKICDYFNISKYFDYMAGSNLDGTRVEKIEILKSIYSYFPNMNKNDIIMIGDRKFDIEGASEFGIRSIGVSYGYGGRDELEAAGADLVVDTVEELKQHLI